MGICRLAAEQKGVPAAGTLLCAGEWPWRTNSIWVSPGRREDTWITVRCCRFAVKRWVCWLNVAYLSLFDTLFSVRTLLGIPRLQSTTGWCVVFGLVLTGPLQCLCCLEIKLLGVLLTACPGSWCGLPSSDKNGIFDCRATFVFCCTQNCDCVLSSIADIPCEVQRGHQKMVLVHGRHLL